MLKITVPEANHSCNYDQLCVVLKAGINGSLHRDQYSWYSISTKINCVFLLIDAKNAIGEINQIGVLWTVSCLWPSGARFVTGYCLWSLLALKTRMGRPILSIVGRV